MLTAGALPQTTRDLPSEAGAGSATTNAAAVGNGAAEALVSVRVTARGLNVRRTPNVAPGNVIGGLHGGAVVTPLAHAGDWLRIEYRGDPGFIHGGFAEPVETRPAASGPAAMSGAAPADVSPRAPTPASHLVETETAQVPGHGAESTPGHAAPDAGHPPSPSAHPTPRSIHPDAPSPQRPGPSSSPSPAAARQPAPTPHVAPPGPGPSGTHAATPDHASDSSHIAPAAPTTASWTPPAGSKLEDPQLLALATKVHDPKLDQLLLDLGGVLALNKTLRETRSLETRFEVKGKDRAMMVAGIGVVRGELDGLANPSDVDVTAFKVAVNHKLEEVAPYHFQLNIPTIESPGGWSTCNLTSLAMALEVIGKGASAYPASEHQKLLAVATTFRRDIAQARLATNGTGTDISSLMGLRLPDFLELAAVVEFITSAAPGHDEIVTAATRAVDEKLQARFLKQLARKFGAEAKDKTIRWDQSKTPIQNRATTNALENFGGQHRGDGSHGVEQLSTARNLLEKDGDPRKRAVAKRRYESLLAGQTAAVEGRGIEGDLSLQTYKSAVVRELGPELDAGRGVIAGLYRHWTRLYGIDDDHILVQDPGAWNRTEINVTWAEVRAMGYFWTNLVIS